MKSNPSAREMVQIDLIRRTAGGDPTSFRKLFDLTSAQVYNYLISVLKVPSVVDSSFTETYQMVWKNAKSYRPTLKVSIWILGIARSIAQHRLTQDDVRKLINNQKVKDFDKTSSDTINQHSLQMEALNSLKPYHREILGLILMPHTTYPDIAKLLNIPLQTVKRDVFEAKIAFRKNMVLDSSK